MYLGLIIERQSSPAERTSPQTGLACNPQKTPPAPTILSPIYFCWGCCKLGAPLHSPLLSSRVFGSSSFNQSRSGRELLSFCVVVQYNTNTVHSPCCIALHLSRPPTPCLNKTEYRQILHMQAQPLVRRQPIQQRQAFALAQFILPKCQLIRNQSVLSPSQPLHVLVNITIWPSEEPPPQSRLQPIML